MLRQGKKEFKIVIKMWMVIYISYIYSKQQDTQILKFQKRGKKAEGADVTHLSCRQRAESSKHAEKTQIKALDSHICWPIDTKTLKRNLITCLVLDVKFYAAVAEEKSKMNQPIRTLGSHIYWPIGTKITNLVENLEFLLLVRFREISVQRLQRRWRKCWSLRRTDKTTDGQMKNWRRMVYCDNCSFEHRIRSGELKISTARVRKKSLTRARNIALKKRNTDKWPQNLKKMIIFVWKFLK